MQSPENCQNCKQQFTIEEEDKAFYAKMQVPPPTFCPRCRFQRRLAWFNLFNLYKRTCDLCKEEYISMYHPDTAYVTYCPACWWSDDWDPLSYGRDYDFSKPFFEQFDELLHQVPLLGLSIDVATAKSFPWNNHVGYLKNCYLLFASTYNENSAYGVSNNHVKEVIDSSLIGSSELCYDSIHCYKDYGIIGGDHATGAVDCAFVRDASNCQNCFASANLKSKQYYLFNNPYTKEQYMEELKKWDLGSHKVYQELKTKAHEHWKNYPPQPVWDTFSQGCTGNYVFESKNSKECYEVTGAQDSKYLFMLPVPFARDCYDISYWGDRMTLCYEGCVVGENSGNMAFCQESGTNLYNAQYCKLVAGGSDHFGCVGVKRKQYCILNKQYSKEDYTSLRAKIIEHMNDMPYTDKGGRVYRYGEFFPAQLSPAAYNETFANNFFPLREDQAIKEGYRWLKKQPNEYTVTKKASELPDHIKDADETILQEVIECEHCQKGFKMIKMELEFLKRRNLPLPRRCPFCRVEEKFSQWVKELRSLKRICSKCGKEFMTPYDQEQFPTIYCKACYFDQLA